MLSLLNTRNSKKAWAVYAVGLFLICSIGLVIKNFNDKLMLMTESVESYQQMVEKQTEQMKTIAMEKERYKRDLKEEKEVNAETIREMEVKVTKLEDECKQENAKLEAELSDLQEIHNNLQDQNKKLENKYKTLSKANSGAIADLESYKSENKRLRNELHDASTAKATELMQLRDNMARLTLERDKSSGQYSALFKQHQQSLDSLQLLQDEKDRLQEQIREIQRLSGQLGAASSKPLQGSSPVPEVHQVQPQHRKEEQNDSVSSSTARAPLINQVMEEPGVPGNASSTSSAPPVASGQSGAQAPPPAQDAIPLPVQAAARVVRYPAQPHRGAALKQKTRNVMQQLQPIQPVQHYHEESDQGQDIDALQAPQLKKLYYPGQDSGGWYPGNVNSVRQVVPQVRKYGAQVHHDGGGWHNLGDYGYEGQGIYQRGNRGRDF